MGRDRSRPFSVGFPMRGLSRGQWGRSEDVAADAASLALRLSFGSFMLLAYGWPKLMNFDHWVDIFPTPFGWNPTLAMGLIVAAEVGCAALLIAGLSTRMAALPLVFAMAVALLDTHAGEPWQGPTADIGRERPAVYLAAFVAIALLGGRRWSVDRWRASRRSTRTESRPTLPAAG